MGAAAIFARYALTAAAPLAVAAARLCIAAAVLLTIALVARERASTPTPAQRLTLIAAGAVLAAHFATWIASLDYTTVAISTLLVSTSPLFTTLYDAVVRRRRFPLVVPLAFITGVAGLLMITRANHSPAPHPGHAMVGALLALTGAAAFAAYLLLVREVRADLSTRAIVTTTYTAAAIVLVILALLAHQPPPPVHAYAAWGGILAMALISQLLGHTGMNAALRWFSPTAISFSTLLEPVIAAALALVLFGETLSGLALAGALLLLGSIGTVLWIAPD
ncbi:MAG TPA: EamA family transporter [Verrucomicrobiae bacterium]|nr:EamA family transporter [Verrucomicrobiae bacterium]